MHVVLSLNPGGTERLVIEIAKRLQPSVESVVCCLDESGEWAHELTTRAIPVLALGRRAGFRPSLGLRIAQLARQHQVGVLHCHHYSPFVYGRLAACLTPALRVVFTEHGRLSDAGPSRKRQLVNPFLGRMPGAIYAVSHVLRDNMIEEGFPAERVGVIHNGIDAGRLPSSVERLAARRALGVGAEALVVGSTGRLDPVKDLGTLLEAFALARRARPLLRLVLIGEGPERQRLERHAADLGVRGDVLFAGYRQDVRRLLPALDLYASTSTYEGVSLTILEAMAAGVPVVATKVGGTPEVVMDGETGVLIPARSPHAAAAAVERVLGSAGWRLSLREAARFRVKRHFSIDAMVGQYLDSYRAPSDG